MTETALGLLLAAILLFIIPLIGVVVGAFAGWVVGLFFEGTVLGTLSRFGVNSSGLEVWQVGATLGFVGGFFKSTLEQK